MSSRKTISVSCLIMSAVTETIYQTRCKMDMTKYKKVFLFFTPPTDGHKILVWFCYSVTSMIDTKSNFTILCQTILAPTMRFTEPNVYLPVCQSPSVLVLLLVNRYIKHSEIVAYLTTGLNLNVSSGIQ